MRFTLGGQLHHTLMMPLRPLAMFDVGAALDLVGVGIWADYEPATTVEKMSNELCK